MLRRLEKRILVDLPSLEARQAMLKQYLPPLIHSVEGSVEIKTEIDYEQLAKVGSVFILTRSLPFVTFQVPKFSLNCETVKDKHHHRKVCSVAFI